MNSTSESQRDKLIAAHRSWAGALAWEIIRTLPSSVDRDDVLACAELGLVEAAQAFDSERGVQFKTFSWYRIRGAIFDFLRRERLRQLPDAASLPIQTTARERFDEAANSLLTDFTEAPAEVRTAVELREQIRHLGASLTIAWQVSLDALPQEPADTAQENAEERLLRQQRARQLRVALDQLPDKYRQVLEAYYFKGLGMQQIAEMLGVGKPRISRIHARSLEMLREWLSAQP